MLFYILSIEVAEICQNFQNCAPKRMNLTIYKSYFKKPKEKIGIVVFIILNAVGGIIDAR
jgi:hypothetical protein